MRLLHLNARLFKRFTDLTITDLPRTAKVVMMAGPNGSGKSSVFDAFRTWLFDYTGDYDEKYHQKQGIISDRLHYRQMVELTLSENVQLDSDTARKLFYFRTAYRNEPDFTSTTINLGSSKASTPIVSRLIDNDVTVSRNYQRLVSKSALAAYDEERRDTSFGAFQNETIGVLRDAMRSVFSDVELVSLGDEDNGASFFFDKGMSKLFHYKNLSGGEKAVFDLLLDLSLNRSVYTNSIYCIDEPEAHMNTRLQARLLREIIELVPDSCQLWVATHSIGMMREARDRKRARPDEVIFLDFAKDFDQPQILRPIEVTREFWKRNLEIALDDLADLVAPKELVICEGQPVGQGRTGTEEFDASCYRIIFGTEYPDTAFISAGNAQQASSDALSIDKILKSLVRGVNVWSVIDRDNRNENEVAELNEKGVRVLSRRHLESYLLDDEVLRKFCSSKDKSDEEEEVINKKRELLEASRGRGNPSDDIKSIARDMNRELQRILDLSDLGSTTPAFLRDNFAKLITPDMEVYKALRNDVFGQIAG